MNINEIKAAAGITGTLALVRQFTQPVAPATEGEKTQWVSHWDNEKRIRVTMHEDVMNKLKAEPTFAGLALKSEVVAATPERAAYTRFVVITPNNIEATF